jgi:hypothetical protein
MARRAVVDYTAWYNGTRLHSTLGCRSPADPALQEQARLLSLAADRDCGEAAVEASAALVLAVAVRRAERPGWDVVATDVHGQPWTGSKTASTSHGAWPAHLACGTIAKLRPAPSTARPAGRPRVQELT